MNKLDKSCWKQQIQKTTSKNMRNSLKRLQLRTVLTWSNINTHITQSYGRFTCTQGTSWNSQGRTVTSNQLLLDWYGQRRRKSYWDVFTMSTSFKVKFIIAYHICQKNLLNYFCVKRYHEQSHHRVEPTQQTATKVRFNIGDTVLLKRRRIINKFQSRYYQDLAITPNLESSQDK